MQLKRAGQPPLAALLRLLVARAGRQVQAVRLLLLVLLLLVLLLLVVMAEQPLEWLRSQQPLQGARGPPVVAQPPLQLLLETIPARQQSALLGSHLPPEVERERRAGLPPPAHVLRMRQQAL